MTFSTNAISGDINNFSAINQTEFLSLSKDLAATTNTKAIEPAAPLGITGFDVSASASLTNTQAGAAWSKVSGSNMDHLTQTKLSLSKGLSGGWDVGGFVSKVSSTNVSATGMHVKYALLEGNAITPAIAVRASHSRMGGVSGMELNNTGLDVLISKGFVGFTPYAGVGTVYSNAKATGKNDESFTQSKSFVGVSWNIVLLNLSAEYDRTGKNSSVGIKAGVRF
ncbi:hypothetical protein B9Z35_05680 [Limnohabitans sp. Jir61]|nr:hypothetical protein B9Z35_05680 [Limnohabitans sp. Jir61]